MFNKLVGRVVDNKNPESISVRLRRSRTRKFLSRMRTLPSPIHLLDVGGTLNYWQLIGRDELEGVELTILNVDPPADPVEGITFVRGDATHMPEYRDEAFDVIFSNSVIEHVGDFEAQKRMAQEIQRVGKCYYLQTPNFWFPIEPHFLFPGFQWLPVRVRMALLRRFNLGWIKRIPDAEKARAMVENTRLLTRAELKRLFPGAEILPERWMGFVKSWMVLGGWSAVVAKKSLRAE